MVSTRTLYSANVTAVSEGNRTAGTLKYAATGRNDNNANDALTVPPMLPQRPLGGDFELASWLTEGDPVVLVYDRGSVTMLLVKQETYAVEECP